MLPNKSFCPLPWIHFSVNTDSSVRICCNTNHGGNVLDEKGEVIFLSHIQSVDDYYNNSFMRKIREDMLNGERNPFCSSCHRIEDAGGTSIRQIYVQAHPKVYENAMANINRGKVKQNIEYIDFSLGNICNIKCRMCGPQSSQHLNTDFEQLNWGYNSDLTEKAFNSWKNEDHITRLVDPHLKNLKEFLVTGGEPLISMVHLKLLERMVQSGHSQHVRMRYHTNLMKINPKILELWKNFSQIELHISLEGVGEVNDYIRHLSRWEVITANMRKLIEMQNDNQIPIHFEIHTCFQIYNVLRVTELFEFLKGFSENIPFIPHPILLDHPTSLSVYKLPIHLKKRASDQITQYFEANEDFINQSKFKNFLIEKRSIWLSYCKLMLENDESAKWQEFLNYAEGLDSIRDQDLFSLFPELNYNS